MSASHCADPVPALADWEFAGLMLTYWCNAQCAFCYVNGGPHQAGDMSVAAAVAWWRGLAQLAASHGKVVRIHLTGGEPFRDWTRLVSIIRAARDAGLGPLEKVETNAFWATDDGLIRARLELLDALGMQRLIVSADVFHQEFVPFERVRRCVDVARQVLGPGRLIVRWWDFFQKPVLARAGSPADRAAALRAALEHHPERLTGRAADALVHLLPRQPAHAFAGQSCTAEVLLSKHVHVDPAGYIFPGTCAGIILGQAAADDDAAQSVVDVWGRLAAEWPRHPVLSAVVAGGSVALLERVRALGYRERPAGYASKCHLCWDIRRFLVGRGQWSEFVGPPACYGASAEA